MLQVLPERNHEPEKACKCVARILCGLPVDPVEWRVVAVGVVVAALQSRAFN